MKQLGLVLLTFFLLCSCASKPENLVSTQEPLEEIHPDDIMTKEPGSLWERNHSSLFSDQKARTVGDIVTVIISESSSASKESSTSTDRSTSMSAGIPNFFGLENDPIWTDSYNPIDISNLVKADFSNSFAGNGTTTRKEDLTASLTTQVIGKYPNGQLKIRGGKEVMVNDEVQIIYLTGIIRPVDITAANTISSTKILNARISYTGKGSISDKNQPGWAMRILDTVWPF